jgi:CPA1 family monovalent cation:H+ antiporter
MPDGAPFPARELAIFLASAVILLSLLMASIGLPRALKGLKLPEESAEHQEEDRARHDAAIAAIAAIEKSLQELPHQAADADITSDAAARVIALYQRRLDREAAGSGEVGQLQRAEQAERALRLAGLRAEREAIFNLARQSRISDATSRKLVREIDLVESRYL